MHTRAYSIQHSHLAEMHSSPVSTGIELLALIGQRRPSMMPADRSLLAGGDSCCCCCWVSPEVCFSGVISPLICASYYHLFLLPVNRQRETTSGDLKCFRVLSDLGSKRKKISPDLCSRGRLQPPFPLSPKLVIAPGGCAPRPNVSPSYRPAALRVRSRALDVLEDDNTS